MSSTEHATLHQWRARIRKRRGKAFQSVTMKELNLVAMMDMMTIILVFLLKSYSGSALSLDIGENIKFPASSNVVAPEEAERLTVTKISDDQPGKIIVGEETVLVLDKKTLASLNNMAKKRDFLIPQLHKSLKLSSDKAKVIAAQITDKNFEGKILVVADAETPYWLLTQVLYSAAQASYDKYHLVAIKKGQ